MAVELILIEDVEELGKLGEKVRVADGYARNYLLPRNLAVSVTGANLRRLEAKKLRMQQEHEERIEVAQALAEKIGQESVTIPVQASEEDKLYGSVTGTQIAEALAESGITIDRHAVVLEEPIKELGVYSVKLSLHADVEATLKVWVVRA